MEGTQFSANRRVLQQPTRFVTDTKMDSSCKPENLSQLKDIFLCHWESPLESLPL